MRLHVDADYADHVEPPPIFRDDYEPCIEGFEIVRVESAVEADRIIVMHLLDGGENPDEIDESVAELLR